MEITWYGLGCLRIIERGYPAIVTDPFDEEETSYPLPHLRADVVTVSIPQEDPREIHWKGIRGTPRVLASPGEYEIGGLFINGVSSYRDHKSGAELGENVIYSFSLNGLSFCHLGNLGHVPTQTQVERMGSVSILFVPVGLPKGLTPSMASEVVSLIEPNIVIPIQYTTPGLNVERETVDRFLKEMGAQKEAPVPVLKLASNAIPEETQIVLLEAQQI